MNNFRMCVSCHLRLKKNNLIRLYKENEEIFIDLSQKSNGYGVYFCKKKECVLKAQKRKVLNRCFSLNLNPKVYNTICGFLENEEKNIKKDSTGEINLTRKAEANA